MAEFEKKSKLWIYSNMSQLFLQGWHHEVTGYISEALKYYELGKYSGDKCSEFHWNCLDRYGQHLPINVNNDMNFDSLALNDEEWNTIYDCYRHYSDIVHIIHNLAILCGTRQKYDEMLKYLIIASERHYAPSQYELGIYYNNGQNYILARTWWILSANAGYVYAQYKLGQYYHDIEQDHIASRKWLLLAAENGHSESQYLIGESYHYGIGVTKNYKLASYWYELSNKPYAYFGLGRIYYYIDNYTEAHKWWLLAANYGIVESYYELGRLYQNGWGVNIDLKTAESWYIKATNRSSIFALIHLYETTKNYTQLFKWLAISTDSLDKLKLARLYAKGLGTKKDVNKAISIYLDNQQYLGAQIDLAELYTDIQDYELAKMWYITIVEAGYSSFYSELGRICFLQHDYGEARKWWLLGTDNSICQLYLGILYQEGIGTIPNFSEALKCYAMSLNNGYNKAQKYLDDCKTHVRNIINEYITNNSSTMSYLLFCNIIQCIHNTLHIENWDDLLLRSWITEYLNERFMMTEGKKTLISSWFVDLFGE